MSHLIDFTTGRARGINRGTGHALNFDAMEPAELFAFWARHQRGRNARELFPAGGTGTRRATAGLANYASNIGAAKGCRIRGDIPAALNYERIADRIYNALPDFARW